jgi:hypothetical protein
MQNAVTALFLFYLDPPWPKQLGGSSVHSASHHVVLLHTHPRSTIEALATIGFSPNYTLFARSVSFRVLL